MPVFSRRRLRSMIDDVSSLTTQAKINDFVSRLESKETPAALAAEAELSVVWAISQVADITIEPLVANGRRPDALTPNLFASGSAVVEVRALSDDSFSGRDAMKKIANKIAASAERIAKNAGSHLVFEFHEHSYWDGRFQRERCVDPAFEMNPRVETLLREWISGQIAVDAPEKLRITEGKTDVIVTWCRTRLHERCPVFCRMPAVAYDLEDNSVYKAIRQKSKQIKHIGEGCLRVVVLFDAGCDLLLDLGRKDRYVRATSGDEIIQHALRKLGGIDIVCAISPSRKKLWASGRDRTVVWNLTYYDRRTRVPNDEYDGLERLANTLPQAQFSESRSGFSDKIPLLRK